MTSHGRTSNLTTDETRLNVESYLYSDLSIFPAEQKILDSLPLYGRRILDLGCGVGRVTEWLSRRDAEIYACDLDGSALRTLASRNTLNAHTVQGDARALPFANGFFELVVFAFNGLDFLRPESERYSALKEIVRVLKDGGHFVFSSHNPLGMVLSPRGLHSATQLRWRVQYVRQGNLRKKFFEEDSGLTLYQAPPKVVIEEIEMNTGLEFLGAVNRGGTSKSLKLLRLFSAWPYFTFRKKSQLQSSPQGMY